MTTEQNKTLNADFFEQNPVIVFFDTETTGLKVENGDKLIQFAGVRVENGVITSCYEQKIKPVIGYKNGREEVKLVGSSEAIHRISDEMLKDQPTLPQVANDIAQFLDGALIVAHNGNGFDIPFIDKEFENIKFGKKIEDFTKGKLDTLVLSREFNAKEKGKGKHTLDAITQRYSCPEFYRTITLKEWKTGKDVKIDLATRLENHDALVDSALLAEVTMKLLREKWDLSLRKDFDKKIAEKRVFKPFVLKEDYQPVIATISERDQTNNIAYLNTLEKEMEKTAKKAKKVEGEVINTVPKMKSELLKNGVSFEYEQQEKTTPKMKI